MRAGNEWEGWAQQSVNFVLPSDVRQTTLVDDDDYREETGFATWLAKVVRYALYSETVGIVLRSDHGVLPRLIATSGVPPDARAAWWNQIRTEIPDLGVNDKPGAQSSTRHTSREGHPFLSDSSPRLVRLVLPLQIGNRRLGVLIVEFRFGERIMPDTLLRARAFAHLVSIALDHERLAHEHGALTATTKQLRQEIENTEAALTHVVHELRGPLTTMKLGTQLAERQLRMAGEGEMLTESAPVRVARAKSSLSLAGRSVETAERMLSDLTDSTRIRAGVIEMRAARCDLAAVVHDAVAGQRVAWPKRIIHLEVPDDVVPVMVDADRVSQVVCNYLTNALKYSPDQQPVEVHVEIERGTAYVMVCDHGIGIAADDQRRVWERFYRTRGINTYSAGSLGVGLFICRQLIEQMGGRVGVRSAVGEGSMFWFAIPLATA